jgi:hypothetical protein
VEPLEEKLRLRGSSIRHSWILAMLWLPLSVVGADMSEEDLREEIVLRCHYDMGEFGVEGVRLCIDADNAALSALSAYPDRAKAIVSRCTRQMQMRGWAMVKLCVDQDLAAEDALRRYAEQHKAVIESCQVQVGIQGPAKVKACADRQISAESGAGKR